MIMKKSRAIAIENVKWPRLLSSFPGRSRRFSTSVTVQDDLVGAEAGVTG